MGLKVPKITVDPTALKHGLWGNTWREWGLIAAAFLALYCILTGYFTGMLFAAKGIRQDAYRTMSGGYFGDFDRTLFNATLEAIPSTGRGKDPHYFNRPDGCVAMEASVPLPGVPGVNITQPTGILNCSNTDNQWRWTVYPWVLDTQGLGQYPGCANADGSAASSASFIDNSSPAGEDASASTPAARGAYVCQNNLLSTAVLA